MNDSSSEPHILLGKGNFNETQAGVCFDFPNAVKIDVLLTYQCNAACAHCITSSDPYKTEWVNTIEVKDLLRTGREFGKRYVSFTGGEPTLHLDPLLSLIRYAHSLGYYTACDTNAHWGTSSKRAKAVVSEFANAGLNALFPSADSYHLPYIPITSVISVVEACDAVGLPCEINYCPGPDEHTNASIIGDLKLLERGFFSDGLSLTGRDVSAFEPLFPRRKADEILDIGSMHLGVSPRGDCYANVDISYECKEFEGTPLFLGNLTLDGPATILKRELLDPFIGVMQTWAPADVHEHLMNCPHIAASYERHFAQRTFLSATEYWLEVLHAPFASQATELLRRLPKRTRENS